MNRAEKETFKQIIDGFEEHYRVVQRQDSLPENSVTRAAFYESCLKIVRDGPRLKSAAVQAELVHYYAKLRDDAYANIVSLLD